MKTMTKDLQLGNRLLMSGTLRATTWMRFLPVGVAPMWVGRSGWRIWDWRGVVVNVFQRCWYVGLVRL